MFCCVYGDDLGLFVPGTLKAMFNGQLGSLGRLPRVRRSARGRWSPFPRRRCFSRRAEARGQPAA